MLLDGDRYVSQWSGIYTANLKIDGQSVSVLGESPSADVQTPVLSGHGLEGPNQVVLGAITMAQLHKKLGETVTASSGLLGSARLRVVGTTAMPTLCGSGGAHLEMGTGALLSYQLIPAVARNPFDNAIPGSNAVLLRLRAGLAHAAALRSLRRIAADASSKQNFGVGVLGVLRPAEIVNYRSLGSTPVI